MTLPANIRVNTSAPFPATVKGSGLVSVGKQNGIWTVSLFPLSTLAGVPAGTDPATILVLVWNTVLQSYQQTTAAALVGSASKPTNISFANSPYPPLASDTFLYVDTSGGAIEIDLPLAASRNNVAISIKDVTGNAAANNITIKPSGAETIDGHTNAAPLVIKANYGGVRLSPGTAKYVIAP